MKITLENRLNNQKHILQCLKKHQNETHDMLFKGLNDLNYDEINGVLLKAIQQTKENIKSLESKIKNL